MSPSSETLASGPAAHLYKAGPLSFAELSAAARGDAETLSGQAMAVRMDPLVTIVIPTFNQEQYVEECLRSVLEQDYRNIEVVVADDASVDETFSVAERILGGDERTHVLLSSDTNLGMTPNLMRGLEQARGKYVALFAGDDLFLPGKLRKQVALMESDPSVHLSYHDMDVFWDDGSRPSFNWSRLVRPRQGDAASLIRYGHFPCAPSFMCRREAMPVRLPSAIPHAVDWLLAIQTTHGGSIRYIDEVLGRYRRHQRNVSNTTTNADPFMTLAIVEAMYPEYHRSVRLGRGRILLEEANRCLSIGDSRAAKAFARHALAIRKIWAPARYAFLVSTSLGADVYKVPLVRRMVRAKPALVQRPDPAGSAD